MTRQELESIFEQTPKLPRNQRDFAFRDGMTVLFHLFEESDGIASDRDQIWYGTVDDVLDKITVEQAMRLRQYGWFIDEDSFSFCT